MFDRNVRWIAIGGRIIIGVMTLRVRGLGNKLRYFKSRVSGGRRLGVGECVCLSVCCAVSSNECHALEVA